MNIVTKVSKRDIMLLIILAVFLVATGLFWFVIRPMDAKISALNGEIDGLEMQAQQYQMQSGQLAGVEAQLKDAMTAYESAAATLTKDTTEEEISRLVVNTVHAYHGTIVNFYIEQSKGASEDNYYTGLQPYGGEESESEWHGIFGYTVNMVITGNQDELQSLIDVFAGGNAERPEGDVLTYPQIRIASFSWKEADKYGATATDESILTLSLQVFTVEPIEEGEN